jgi:hypothetical protein
VNTDNPQAPAVEAEDLAASNGHPSPSAAAEAPPCADCEDGLTIGLGRGTERALGLFGIVMGGLIVLMGIDLLTGGRLAQLAGMGRADSGD